MAEELVRLNPSVGTLSETARLKRVKRFRDNRGLVIRRTTHVAQNTRHSQAVTEDFVAHINELNMEYDIRDVVNMDETNLPFDLPSRKTIERRGKRTINMKTTGNSNRATVMLAVYITGRSWFPSFVTKEPPAAVSLASSDEFPRSLEYATQPKAWVDGVVMLKWVKKVWAPWCKHERERHFS